NRPRADGSVNNTAQSEIRRRRLLRPQAGRRDVGAGRLGSNRRGWLGLRQGNLRLGNGWGWDVLCGPLLDSPARRLVGGGCPGVSELRRIELGLSSAPEGQQNQESGSHT